MQLFDRQDRGVSGRDGSRIGGFGWRKYEKIVYKSKNNCWLKQRKDFGQQLSEC
jgi:hypothetical protein